MNGQSRMSQITPVTSNIRHSRLTSVKSWSVKWTRATVVNRQPVNTMRNEQMTSNSEFNAPTSCSDYETFSLINSRPWVFLARSALDNHTKNNTHTKKESESTENADHDLVGSDLLEGFRARWMLCGKISMTVPWLERETVSGLDIEESKMNGRAVPVECNV